MAELLMKIPFRVWVVLIVVIGGLTLGYMAITRIDTMNAPMDEILGARPVTPTRSEPAPTRSSSDPVLARVYAAADAMGLELRDGAERLTVEDLVRQAEGFVSAGHVSRAQTVALTLEGYRGVVALSCQIRIRPGAGPIKVGDDAFRVPTECQSSDGKIVHPTAASLLPVVTGATLANLPPTKVIGNKEPGRIEAIWAIPTVQ